MKKYLILLSVLGLCLLSCNRYEYYNDSTYASSLLSQRQYRKVIKVLDRDTTRLSVPMDVPDLYMAELNGYDTGVLAEYYYFRAYSGLEKYRKAAVHIVRYLKKTGHDRPYYESGIALKDMCYVMSWFCRDYSIELLEESLADDKGNYQLKLMLALLYADNGEYPKAIGLCDEIESVLDSNQRTSLNNWKSSFYMEMNEDTKAVEEMTGALKKSGYVDLTDLYQRATIYQYGRKDYESAINDYTRMIELSDEAYNAYYGRSSCYSELGDTLAARKDFVTAEHIQDSLIKVKYIKDSVSMSISIRQRFGI